MHLIVATFPAPRGLAHGQDLGVGRGIAGGLSLVAGRAHHLTSGDNHCPDGHLTCCGRPPGVLDGRLHGALILHGGTLALLRRLSSDCGVAGRHHGRVKFARADSTTSRT